MIRVTRSIWYPLRFSLASGEKRRGKRWAWCSWRCGGLQEEDVVELVEERKAAMVSNLLVVLCSEQATQQVVNTGSLYQ